MNRTIKNTFLSAMILLMVATSPIWSQIPSTLDSISVLPLDSATATSFRVQTVIQLRKFPPQSTQLWLSVCIGYDIALDSAFQQIVQARSAVRQPISCICLLPSGCGTADCNPRVIDSVIRNNFTVSRLLPGTRYYFRANYLGRLNDFSILSLYSRTQTIQLPTSLVSPLTPPIPQQNSDISDKGFRITWDSTLGSPTHFLVDVSLDSSFRTMLPSYTNAVARDTQFLITNLQPATRYFYRIRSTDNQRTSTYSRIGQELTLPSSNLQARQLAIFRPTLINISSRVDSTFYRYFPSQNLALRQIDSILNTLLVGGIPLEEAYSQANLNCRGITVPSEIIVKLRRPNSRMQSFGFNNSAWVWANDCDCPYLRSYSNFIATSVQSQTANTPNSSLTIQPSLASDRFTILVSMPSSSILHLALHDALGREIRTITNGIVSPSLYETSVSVEGLPSGIYFVRCSVGGQVFMRRLAVVR
ncbi:MAG: T9SS type A sorting domain-containing protein [Candidatus Kapabacteria bacterium]|nr:T9SS type A sorting domain-containing protein [Candidatus Kapabacteria bacterium]